MRGFDRLDEVVDGVDFEGAECVLVVGGGEDDEGLHGEAREQIESVDAGHLNVEEEHVDGRGGCVVEIGEGTGGIGGGGNDFQIVEAREEARQALDGERLIVDEIGAERSGFHRQLPYARMLHGKRDADHGLLVFSRNFELAGGTIEQLKTGDEIA